MVSIKKEKRKKGFLFVARQDDGEILTTGQIKKFKTLKNFKRFVQDKTFLFGGEFFEKGKIIAVGKEIIQFQTEEFITPEKDLRAFRVSAHFRNLSASSALYQKFTEKALEEAKEQSIFALATQIIATERGFLAGTYDFDFVDENEADIEFKVLQIQSDTTFKIIYSIDVPELEENAEAT